MLSLIVPSIDTGICSTKHTFNKELVRIIDTVVITISDLPFNKLVGVLKDSEMPSCFSDYYDNSFDKDYGVPIEECTLLARAV